jgi:hypothetical protein
MEVRMDSSVDAFAGAFQSHARQQGLDITIDQARILAARGMDIIKQALANLGEAVVEESIQHYVDTCRKPRRRRVAKGRKV